MIEQMEAENKVPPDLLSLFAREMGRKGGRMRSQKLTPERRIEIARLAGQGNRKKKPAEQQQTEGNEVR